MVVQKLAVQNRRNMYTYTIARVLHSHFTRIGRLENDSLPRARAGRCLNILVALHVEWHAKSKKLPLADQERMIVKGEPVEESKAEMVVNKRWDVQQRRKEAQ